MFMGANPSFMTYGGFTDPASQLIEMHGTPEQKALFLDKLKSFEWDACFCATEPEAGSDVTAVDTRGTDLGDGVFGIDGEKVFISAGMHDLTGNTLYFVLGRTADAARDGNSLSCFLVPRYWVDPDCGALSPNGVECIDLPRKMGLNGCANTRLRFGGQQLTRGWLLGNRRNVGLLQLVPLMSRARMGTGLFAVGLASSAFVHSVRYAAKRVQGRAIDKAADTSAPKVAIIEHGDVQRMLMEMKSRVEACRGLLGKLAMFATLADIEAARTPVIDGAEQRYRKLVQLMTPIAKAYISDQACTVCDLAIQVHGGIGYTDEASVEQNYRDVRILPIWEGTNYIQAQDLIREKLAYGRNPRLLRYLAEEVDSFLCRRDEHPALSAHFDALSQAFEHCRSSLGSIASAVADNRLQEASHFFTRYLEMLGTTLSAWVLLEAACVAQRALAAESLPASEQAFYRGKLKAEKFFQANVLPKVAMSAAVIADLSNGACTVSADELLADHDFRTSLQHDFRHARHEVLTVHDTETMYQTAG
jgi:acyl-CoA dehydrogenase